MVTGPSSTLAGALELEPGLPRLLRRLVVMGGTFRGHPGNTTPVSEWNVDVDPEAADRVCVAWDEARASEPAVAPVLWCGLNLTERAVWTPERSRELLAAADTPLTRALVDALRFYFEFHQAQEEGYQAQIHDLLTCIIALKKVSFEAVETTIDVEADSALMRGTSVADLRNHWDRPANASLVTSADIPAAHREFDRALRNLGTRVAQGE